MAEKECCDLCRVKLDTLDPQPITTRSQLTATMHVRYWLIPESFHEKVVKSQLMTRRECEETFISTCYMCHQAAINYFTAAERYWHLNSESKLRNALEAVGWRRIRVEERNFTPAKLKNFQWVTQRVEDFKNKVCTFKDDSRFPEDVDRDALPLVGEVLDMLEGHKKAAEAREKDLEARLSAKFAAELEQDREKHASDVETIHEKIKVVDDKLENLKTRIGELQEKVNDREGGQNTDEVSTKTKKLARANRELIGILRRDLGELRDEWETSKGALQQADRDRDDRLQHISDEINASKADQANIKRVEKRLHSLEWKVTERVDVAPGGTSKSKGKRKRKEKNQEKELEHEMTSNAQMPDIADADEAMDDDDAAPANKKRRTTTQMSYSNSDYSSDSSSELEIATQSCRQSMLAPSKKHCRTVGVEVEIPSRSFAKRTGRPVSASKTSSMAQTRSQQAMPVHSASSSDVINPRQQISPAKEASTVKSVAAGPAAQSATSPVNDAGSGQAGTETMPHIPNIEKQMSTGDLQPETTEVLKGKVIPTINAEEAVRRAIQAVVSPVYSRASSLSSIAATTAVDLPLSHQAAAASSSGRSRPVHSTVPASSAVHSDSNSLSTEAKHTTVIRHPKPPLYPSSRLKASATASTGVNAEQSDVQVSNTSKSTVSAEPAINTTAGPKIGRFSSLFPSLSREESVESALPDLTELFKHTTTRHACAVVQAEKNDVVYVKSSLGDGHGAKRRRKLAGYALVKEESQDC